MGTQTMPQERRAARRFDITELIFVSSSRESRTGLLRDISRQGAQVEFSDILGRTQHAFAAGDTVNLRVDGLGELPGVISRLTGKGVAIEFRIDGERQEMLRAEIQEAFDAA
ncbi:MAG: PilZ domain-containing protein [Alphaproteobacteria bacterium]